MLEVTMDIYSIFMIHFERHLWTHYGTLPIWLCSPSNQVMRKNETEGLKTDNLENLKEGDTFIDSTTGTRYRVKKTILPHYSSSGPHGLGDPEDRTLRKIEADVIIPNRMNTQIERVECNSSYLDLVKCFRNDGAVAGLNTCKPALEIYNRCKFEKFHDPEFRSRMTDEYLAERSEARRTGMTSQQRKLEEYREWKRKNNTASEK
ncbi:unnamed protein product [Caenorhabditis auriculariae]|uniref:COX assembly mitochondrial protein n=1 Tax=Caenorhabditis auriculariae TaxID=2777116 RepID=A0A8S1GZK8_9PELO|nr:unnamed protein product [Caenorhabditis auriculariae]